MPNVQRRPNDQAPPSGMTVGGAGGFALVILGHRALAIPCPAALNIKRHSPPKRSLEREPQVQPASSPRHAPELVVVIKPDLPLRIDHPLPPRAPPVLVAPRPSRQPVVPRVPQQRSPSRVAEQRVPPVAADQQVIPVSAAQHVVAVPA